ncbi:unnamed protein product [Boreogadus saida]
MWNDVEAWMETTSCVAEETKSRRSYRQSGSTPRSRPVSSGCLFPSLPGGCVAAAGRPLPAGALPARPGRPTVRIRPALRTLEF